MRPLLCLGLLVLTITVYGQSFKFISAGQGSAIIPLGLSSDKQSYFAVLEIGQINFRFALDTASADLWLTASSCTSPTCQDVPRYPLNYQSPTFASINQNLTLFNVSYVDTTSASGYVAAESVTLGNLTVNDQAFGLVTESNVTFVDEISGILGLGFSGLSSIANLVTNSTPFALHLAQQGILDYPLFGLSLTWNSSGTLAIGAIDGSVVKNVSQIEWYKVVEFPPLGNESNISTYLQWAIPLAGFSVNGTQMQPFPTYPNASHNTSLVLFDVGSPGFYGPYQDVSRLFSLIESSRLVSEDGQWAVPCSTDVLISFTFGTQNFTLQPTDYLIGPAEGDPDLCLSWPKALPPSSYGIDWQLGTAFLRTVYSIFSYGIDDKESPMIGLYSLQTNTSTSDSADFISSFFSSISATVATTLPNFLLSPSTYTTPSYAFNSSVSAPTGGIVTTALATSTYSPIFGKQTNLSAIPTITPIPTLLTFLVTDPSGMVKTSVSLEPSITLGVPPGWSAASINHPVVLTLVLAFWGPVLFLHAL